jgi:hypothetical protein
MTPNAAPCECRSAPVIESFGKYALLALPWSGIDDFNLPPIFALLGFVDIQDPLKNHRKYGEQPEMGLNPLLFCNLQRMAPIPVAGINY